MCSDGSNGFNGSNGSNGSDGSDGCRTCELANTHYEVWLHTLCKPWGCLMITELLCAFGVQNSSLSVFAYES